MRTKLLNIIFNTSSHNEKGYFFTYFEFIT
nr:MAG TPA: hypothetical protein [Caudoviricetes sp.]